MAFIYVLCDPRNGEVRYVGQTTDPIGRLDKHIYDTRSSAKRAWIDELTSIGMTPILKTVDKVDDLAAYRAEFYWYDKYTQLGYSLLNGVIPRRFALAKEYIPDPTHTTIEFTSSRIKNSIHTDMARIERQDRMACLCIVESLRRINTKYLKAYADHTEWDSEYLYLCKGTIEDAAALLYTGPDTDYISLLEEIIAMEFRFADNRRIA